MNTESPGSPINPGSPIASTPQEPSLEWPPGTIVLGATPIGNTADASPRLVTALRTWGTHNPADIIAAEDTRRIRALAARLGVDLHAKIVSYHDHNEAARASELVAAAQRGGRILVVSDAGMPAVSDPGYRIVQAAAAAGLTITAIPGPSSVLVALALSGLPSDRFAFEGFVPRKDSQRMAIFNQVAQESRTLVFFESPHRIASTLELMAQAFGTDRLAAVCRELTKTYEEVRRGTLAELARWAAEGLRGEITIVVGPAVVKTRDIASLAAEVRARVAAGERQKDVCRELAARHEVSSRELYQASLLP